MKEPKPMCRKYLRKVQEQSTCFVEHRARESPIACDTLGDRLPEITGECHESSLPSPTVFVGRLLLLQLRLPRLVLGE